MHQFAHETMSRFSVDIHHRWKKLRMAFGILRHEFERFDIFREARATESNSSIQEVRPYPLVESHPSCNVANINVQRLGDPGNLVDERDLGREERIRCVFNLSAVRRSIIKNGAQNGSYSSATASEE
jgi:hypothetical protein